MSHSIKELVWTEDLVKKFWDYESQFPENYFTYQFGKQIVHNIKPFLKNSKSILDFGCGTGFLMNHLLFLGKHVTGTDSSKDSLKYVNDTYKGKAGFQGAFDIEHFQKNFISFEVITLIEVIEHLYDKDLNSVLSLIKSLLVKNGIIVITTPNNEDLEKSKIFCPVSGHIFHRWQHVRSWSQQTLSELMMFHGFETITCYATDLTVEQKFPLSKSYLKYLLQKLQKRKMPHLVGVFRKIK